jgi:DNA-directed RNA polymerase specialized sigma subunit
VALNDPEDGIAPATRHTPDTDLSLLRQEENIIGLFESLGKRDALVLRLRILDDFSHKEIAVHLGISEQDSRTRFKDALNRLRPRVVDHVRRGARI